MNLFFPDVLIHFNNLPRFKNEYMTLGNIYLLIEEKKKSDDSMINNQLMKGLFNIFIYRIDVESFENFRIRI